MVKKIYKILLIILFIFTLKLIFTNNAYAVELAIFDSAGQPIGTTISCYKDDTITLKCGIKNIDGITQAFIDWSSDGEYVETISDRIAWSRDLEGYTWCAKVQFKAKEIGRGKIIITAKTKIFFELIGVDTEKIEIPVNVKERPEEKELREQKELQERLDNDWKKNPEDILTAYDRAVFLQSCVENGQFDKIKNISSGLREQWNINIKSNIRSKYDDVKFEPFTEGINYLSQTLRQESLPEEEQLTEEELEQVEQELEQEAEDRREEFDRYVLDLSLTVQIFGGEDRTDVPFIDVLQDITSYIPNDSSAGTEELVNKVSIILTVITNIGMILAVLMSAIMGVKYMLGSLEEKAEYKKDMIPYLIGSCLLFGICTIVKVLQSIGTDINNI